MTGKPRILVEIAAHCIESALAAQAGGADRAELFSNPIEGGVTPSEGAIAAVRDRLRIDLHVMIRPRGGDFCYSDAELEAMLRDIAVAKRLGANGVAFGLVNQDATVDVARTRVLVGASRPMSVTFHRAVDVCKDLRAALDDVIACGADRVLTSGGGQTAIEGTENLALLVERAGHQIGVTAAGQIRRENVARIVQQTGVREIHAGLRSARLSRIEVHSEGLCFGLGRWFETGIVREYDVRQLVEEVQSL